MNKELRITEFAKQVFGNEKISLKAGEIIEGILTARSPRVSDIADALKGQYKANYKKIQRFLHETDPKEQLHLLFNGNAEFVICDPTEIECLHARKTAFVGPLKDGPPSQGGGEGHHKAIQEVLGLIGDRPMIFDREFSCLAFLQSWLDAHVPFVIRLHLRSSPPNFYYDRDQKIQLHLRITPLNKPKIYRQVYYMGQVKVNLVGIWQYGFRDPIWLITTLETEEALRLYFKRMKIEISFRDLKSLLHMDKMMNKSQERLEKILALVMIVYTISLLLGEAIRDVPYAQIHLAAGRFTYHSPDKAMVEMALLFGTFSAPQTQVYD